MDSKQELTLEETRQIQLNGLLYVKNICEKNNITYYIISGTLLGAVKYKGYIPWDDDIDIALKRQDYLKLIKAIENDNNLDYKILTIYNTKDYYYPYAKLVYNKTKLYDNAKEIKELGVFVDIFPMDIFKENVVDIYKKIRFIRNMASRRMKIKNSIKVTRLLEEKEHVVKHYKLKNFIYSLVDIISKPLGQKFWVKLLDKILSKHNHGEYIGMLYTDYLKYFKADMFDELDNYVFENQTFTSIKNYDSYLTQLYGSYRQDPPLSMQRTHHQLKTYWCNREK